ncbi:MAG: alanine racemase [Desulfosalsimonadaceae bacterium]
MIPCEVWAEINTKALSDNIRNLKRFLKGSVRFMAVVKADAYGHGAVETALRAVDAGADALGVARLGEALELRHAGISAPVLIFGKTRPAQAARLVEYGLTQTVCGYREAADLSARMRALGHRIRVHIKMDTGMGRLGILAIDGENGVNRKACRDAAVEEIYAICRLDGLACEGIYTHFAAADEADKTMTVQQLAIFEDIVARLEKKGVRFDIRHAANSAALIDMPETHLDMVRAGISIYGYYPSKKVNHESVQLTPAMTLKSRIVHIKTVGPGFAVSYGATARTEKKTTIATVAIGYADGLSRSLSSIGEMTLRGRLVPVMGRVCMDSTMLDTGGVTDAAVGDEVTIFGNPENGALSADRLADQTGTISYEVLTSVSRRVCRIYV